MRTLRLFLLSFTITTIFFSCHRNEDDANQVPVANAGPSQNITLPAVLNLTGSGTDADGQIVGYIWSQVSGPNTPIIANQGAAHTAVNGIIAGDYIFQLMVTDNGGATGVDTVSIHVNPAPEVTITLQPANNPTDMTLSVLNGANTGGTSYYDLPILAWTNGGNPVFERSLMKFDWGNIPQNSTIVSANLYLYSFPPPLYNGNFQDANFGSTNALLVQRATTDWSPSTVTWFNQPAGSSANQVVVPHTTSSQLDVNIDVTNLVAAMVSNNANYGFIMKLQNEAAYNCRIFCSSYYNGSATKRPKLVIVYR